MQDVRPASRQLTVCICTRDRPGYLRDCIGGLRRQTVPPRCFEVLIVDSASTPPVAAAITAMAATLGNARVLRLTSPGISLARNAGADSAGTDWIAYLDDDAIPAPDWVEATLGILRRPAPPSLFGGRILPLWEAPLPPWWPERLRGVLSLIEHEEATDYRAPASPRALEPYAANMVVHRPALRAAGGFRVEAGRYGTTLLSDEEVQLAWRLQAMGRAVRHEPSLLVYHQIQAARLNPAWLLRRLFWQGASNVVTQRVLGARRAIWRALPRRMVVAVVFAPAALVPLTSPALIGVRWRLAYSAGFVSAALGWRATEAARAANASGRRDVRRIRARA